MALEYKVRRTTGLNAAMPLGQQVAVARLLWLDFATTDPPALPTAPGADRAARIHAARGRFRNLRITSAELAREKAEEAEWEDRL